MNYKKKDFNRRINLLMKNKALNKLDRDEQIDYLIQTCKNEDELNLVYNLLANLILIDSDDYNTLLNILMCYLKSLELDKSTSQLSAITISSEPDSGQPLVNAVKSKLRGIDLYGIKILNNFNKIVGNYHQGKKNIVILDEFVGSGKTVRSRISTFNKNANNPENANFYFLFLAGMECTVDKLKSEGINIFCALPLKRGISDNFQGKDLELYTQTMIKMESKLAPVINEKKIEEYSFGYGKAEALYSSELNQGNTPNSVFPIFWWILDKKNKPRKNLLNRYEEGF